MKANVDDVEVALFAASAERMVPLATITIPIVFPLVSDPVAAGLIASLAHPGGNLTGFSPFQFELMPKRLDLLTELVPQAGVIALLVNPNDPRAECLTRDMQDTARTKGVQLLILKATTQSEIDAAFLSLVRRHAGALLVAADGLFTSLREQPLALASRYAVPAIYDTPAFTVDGGLMMYGPTLEEGGGISATRNSGKILRGAKPADLPVQQPTKLQLIINLKTAKALGLTVPRMLSLRADEVIE